MVVVSCNHQHCADCPIDHIRRFICCNPFHLFDFLMQHLKTFQLIYFQAIGLLILYIRYGKMTILVLAILLLIFPLLLQNASKSYIAFFNRIMMATGKMLKHILFGILFILLITPLGIIRRLLSGWTKNPSYQKRVNSHFNFTKMW